jgi:hypothetical protein
MDAEQVADGTPVVGRRPAMVNNSLFSLSCLSMKYRRPRAFFSGVGG